MYILFGLLRWSLSLSHSLSTIIPFTSTRCTAYHGCPMGKCDTEPWFIEMKLGQLRELLGGKYGQFAYMWTDHANGDPLFSNVTALANELQPQLLILGQDVQTIGSEYGHLWFNQLWNQDNTTKTWTGEGPSSHEMTTGSPLDPPLSLGGMPDGAYWKSREADKTVSSSGWFWSTGAQPDSVQSLMDLYLRSVGLGSNLILNFPPDRSGQIGPAFVDVAKQFGDGVNAMYETLVAGVHNVAGPIVSIELSHNASVTMIMLR